MTDPIARLLGQPSPITQGSGSPQQNTDYYGVGAARANGSGTSVDDPLFQDLRTMNDLEILAKYGPSEGQRLILRRAGGSSAYQADQRAARDTSEAVGDTAVGVGQGFVNGVGGLVALGAGIVDRDAGAWAAQKLQEMNSWTADNLQSEALTQRRNAAGAETRLNASDNAAQYEEDRESMGDALASLKRIGSNILDEASVTIDDGTLLQDGIAQGGGSLLGGGLISGTVKAVGKAVLSRVGSRVATNAAVQTAARVGGQASMPLAIGGMEGGGAYVSTVNEIMGMTHEELSQNSTEYVDFLLQGMTQQDAKIAVADRAGKTAAAIQAPIGAVTGALVAKFEGAPLRVGSVREGLSNIVRETVEEGIQSGSGQAAQNYAMRRADRDQDLLEGVGENIAQGAIFGAGTAGVFQGPGTTMRATIEGTQFGARQAVRGANWAMNAILSRGDKFVSDLETQSPASAEAMNTAMDFAARNVDKTQDEVIAAVQELDVPEQAKTEAFEYLDKVFNSARMDPEELQGTLPVIGSVIEGSTDRFDAIGRVTQFVADKKNDTRDRLAGAFFILDQFKNNEALINQDLPEALTKLPADHAARQELEAFERVISSVGQHPDVMKAIKFVRELPVNIKPSEVADDVVSTPEGQRAVSNAIGIAEHNPAKANPEVNKQILTHAYYGRVILTPAQVAALESSTAVVIQSEKAKEIQRRLKLDTNIDIVSKEITSDRRAENKNLSALEHSMGVIQAYRAGQMSLAQAKLEEFMKFAQSMQNKTAAYNDAITQGRMSETEPSFFQSLDPATGEFFRGKVWFDPKHWGSIRLAQQVGLDADVVASLANNLVGTMPELGVKPVARVYLDERLNAPAAEVKKTFRAVMATTSDQRAEARAAEIEAGKVKAEPSTTVVVEAEMVPEVQQAEVTEETKEPVTEANATPVDDQPDAQAKPALEAVSDPAVAETTQETKPEAEPEIENEGEQELFPDLLAPRGDAKANRFRQAFSAPTEMQSRILGSGNPLDQVTDNLKSAEALIAVADKLPTAFTAEIAKAYQKYLTLAPEMVTRLQERMELFLKSKFRDDRTMEDFLRAGPVETDVNKTTGETSNTLERWVQGKATNLLNEDGKYNQELLEGAVLAGLQWYLTANNSASILDDETIGEILNKDPYLVTDTDRQFFNTNGVSLNDAKRSLGQKITDFWGVKPNSKIALGYTRGIPEAMAAEVLAAFLEMGMLSEETLEVVSADKYTTPKKLVFQVNDALQETITDVKKSSSAIEHAVMVEPTEEIFIGSPPKGVAEFQMRNRLVRNSDQQKEAIRNEQNTAHYWNAPFIDLLTSMGVDGALELFGAGDLNSKVLNINHKRSLEGKNITIRAAFDAMMEMKAQTQERATLDGTAYTDVPVHFAYNISRVGRLHMLGRHNPQANKLSREMVMPTFSTLDLSQKQQRDVFMLAVGQAWGIKVHKQPRQKTVKDVQKLARKPEVQAALKLVRDWSGSQFVLTNEDLAVIKASGLPSTPAAVNALMEYARYQGSTPEALKSFRTPLYVEADGVTDGPINALYHMATGAFSDNWLVNMAKGGLFVNSRGMTVNSNPDRDDLYTAVQKHLDVFVKARRDQFGQADDTHEHMEALLRLMNQLLPKEVMFNDEGKLVLDRGLVKNPLTVTIYGSGQGGIAEKVMGALIDALYEKMSAQAQAMNDNPKADPALLLFADRAMNDDHARQMYVQFAADLTQLTRKIAVVDRQQGVSVREQTNTRAPSKQTMEDYTFTPDQLANLKENILVMFVDPLSKSISATMGEVESATTLIREATQSQSIFMKYAFFREVERMKEKKKATDDEYRSGDFLTQNDLNEIYGRLKHLSPLIEAADIPLWIGSSDRSDVMATEWAATLDGQLRSDISIHGPKNSGVAGIPTTVIGLGDGRMIQNAAVMDGRPERTIKIFDGIHMPLDKVDEYSEKINQAVHMGWMTNPLGDVEKSFSAFLRDVNFDTVSDAQLFELAGALFTKRAMNKMFTNKVPNTGTRVAVLDRLKNVGKELTAETKRAEARHAVLSKLELTVDHMASGERPFISSGESLDGLFIDDVVQRMNDMLDEELAKETETVSDDIRDDLKALGEPDEVSGARLLSTGEIMLAVNGLSIPAEQKALLRPVLKAVEEKQFSVVIGSPKATSAYAEARGLRRMTAAQSMEQRIQGYTVMGDRMIYLHSGSSETLLHELIHAATMEKVAAYYDGSLQSKEDTAAIERLEGLMNEWLDLEDGLLELNQDVQKSYERAKQAIEFHLNDVTGIPDINKAAALNEFMAWNLSNEELIRVGQRTQVKNPVLRIMGDVLKALKELIWGTARAPKISDDLYSNIRFNTAILLQSNRSVQQNLQDVVSFQSNGFGQNPRLTQLREQFSSLLGQVMKAVPAEPALVQQAGMKKIQLMTIKASKVASVFNSQGFPMSLQEKSTFEMMVAAMLVDAQLNPNSLVALQNLYEYVTKQLTVESLMANPDGNDQADRYQAQQKFDSIMGVNATEYDSDGKSTLLPAFIALANTNDEFRAVLAKMPMPKMDLAKWNTLDNVLTNAGRVSMERLGDMMSGTKRNSPNIQAAIDALTTTAANVAEDEKHFIIQFGQKSADAINKANDILVETIQGLSSKAIRAAEEVEVTSNNKIVQTAASVGKLAAAIVNKEESSYVAMGVMQHLNEMRVWRPIHELMNEIIGRTPEIGKVYDMIKGVKSMVQQTRQQFREELPNILAEKFTRELTDQEWSAMHKTLAKTDAAALRASFSMAEIMRLVSNNSYLLNEIGRLEGRIQANAPQRWLMLQKKSQELATFMVTGKPSGNLLRNAHAVAHLFGEIGALPAGTNADTQLISDIDQLVSLYALKDAPSDLVSALVQDEQAGVEFLLSYLVGQRLDEQSKTFTPRALNNHYKGYIPAENQQGTALIVADDADFADLNLKGFIRVGAYLGSSAERGARSKSYYFSPVSGRAVFNQGIMQNVRATASGVDPVTGFSYNSVNIAGRITDRRDVAQISRLKALNEKATEPLLPVYDEQGEVVAYERSLDPNQQIRLNQNTHLGEMIGAWRGRQVEEAMASHFNDLLIERLYDMWKDDQAQGRQGAYIDLFKNTGDPVLDDAMSLLQPEARQKIYDTFGGDTFMVRKDLLNDVAGYRAPSVGDLWTGNTRLDDNARTQTQRMLIGIFGPSAYRHLVGAEKFYQNVVSAARVMIVVKSVIVPMSNLLSNVYQLSARGVPLVNTLRQMPAKTAEVDQYVKNRLRQIQVEAELRAVGNDLVSERKLKTELQSIKDANRRMSIWPLVEAGEFASVSEGGITREELALTEGRLTDYIETLVDKLPSQVKTAGRYAIIAKDTALYRGLARAIEYGDFLAKSVLYDDLTKRQKLSHEDALIQITEEFVNYDRLPGRTRGYMESMGLLWFWNFKLRSTKIAVSMIRHNPLQTLLTTLAPAPSLFGSVGLPTSDNIISVLADGRLDNSMGLGQGLRAPQLIPWVQLAS